MRTEYVYCAETREAHQIEQIQSLAVPLTHAPVSMG